MEETPMLTLVDETTGTPAGHGVVLDVTELGSGAPVVVLHGSEGAEADYEFLKTLADERRVIAPSHPGFGLSPRPDWCTSVEDLSYLYLDWLDRIDAHDVTLVGLQFGGWLAAEIAVRRSPRISRLVLVDAVGIKVGSREDRDIADVFAMSRTDLDARQHAVPETAPGDLSLAPREQVLHIARNEEALALYGWEPYLHNPRLRRWLDRIDVPTLVLWGEADGIVSPEYGRRYAEAIPGARFGLVPGAAHRAQIDQPYEIAARIRDFSA
jgi:pimeloyl-ACP methyl ester carboxylesterase